MRCHVLYDVPGHVHDVSLCATYRVEFMSVWRYVHRLMVTGLTFLIVLLL